MEALSGTVLPELRKFRRLPKKRLSTSWSAAQNRSRYARYSSLTRRVARDRRIGGRCGAGALRPDVAFIALHGPGGEDGTVQELLEILAIPYTGPGVAACLRCMDKVLSKHILREAGIPTPDWVAFNSTAFRSLGAADALGEIEAALGFPLVVKPAGQGSSLGVRFAGGREGVPEALLAAFSYDDRVLLERHVDGRELAVSILAGEPLPVVEAVPTEADRFDYEARYDIGRTRYECPAAGGAAAAGAVGGGGARRGGPAGGGAGRPPPRPPAGRAGAPPRPPTPRGARHAGRDVRGGHTSARRGHPGSLLRQRRGPAPPTPPPPPA
jgi:D-alanine--D-alanine ligase